jgi:pimeloyl-ACP methyl ester carboxylesterase
VAKVSAAASLESRPLIVLAAEVAVKNDPVWLPAQQQVARLSSNAKLIVVEGSSDYVHWDRPALVGEAITQVVEAARTDRHLTS